MLVEQSSQLRVSRTAPVYLDRGYAVASSSLNVWGNNCNERPHRRQQAVIEVQEALYRGHPESRRRGPFGRMYSPTSGKAYLGMRPSKKSIRRMAEKPSDF